MSILVFSSDKTLFFCSCFFNKLMFLIAVSSRGIVVSPGSTPKFCSAYGLYHELNQPFIVTDGCFRLRCRCHSDGSWECPSNQAIYFCPTNSRQVHRGKSRPFFTFKGLNYETFQFLPICKNWKPIIMKAPNKKYRNFQFNFFFKLLRKIIAN